VIKEMALEFTFGMRKEGHTEENGKEIE